MNRTKPRVLVVLPVWNAEATLQEALDSVFLQQGPTFRVLAVDDGSQDRSLEILRAQRDPRLEVHARNHEGLCLTMNHCIRYAATERYEYLMRMDSDDLSKPGRFERLVRYLDAKPAYAAASSNCEYFTSDGKGVGSSTVSVRKRQIAFEIRHGLRGLIQGASCFRTAALMAVGGYRPVFQVAEDADLFLRLAERFDLGNVGEYLYRIRVHSRSRSRADLRRNVFYAQYALDCARRRARARPERSVEEYARWAERYSLELRREYWSMSLWEASHRGGWRMALAAPAAVLSPRRLVARALRAVAG